MAGYDKDEVPMLSDTHPQYSDDNVQLKLDKFMSRTRSASVSIPMSSVDSSYEGKPRLVGHTGPLRSQSKTLFVPMSGPLNANRRPDSIFRPVQAPTAGQEAVEPAGEKFPSTNATTENEWEDENYVGKNEHLLRSGQLGLCNDPYCTTCPTFNLKAAQEKHRRASDIFDPKFHNALYGDAKGWARRFFSFLRPYIPGVMNPHAKFVQRWNKFFVISCLISIFVDPLFFFLLSVEKENSCIVIDWPLTTTLVVFRSITDFILLLHILLQFRLAYVAPESRVVGAGELVDHPKKIALNYLQGYFLLDFFIVLPLPQIIILLVLRNTSGLTGANHAKNLLRAAVLLQYIPRLYRFLPFLAGQTPSGFIFESAWANFVINLLTFVLSGHVVGSCWYLLGLQRVNQCFREACHNSAIAGCMDFLDCGHGSQPEDPKADNPLRDGWRNNVNATACLTASGFDYGIYGQAVNLTTENSIVTRYVYGLFWGFQQISTLAGNLIPSYFVWEVLFTMAIIGLGLLLFALLIGNMQNFLQALGRRRLEMSLRRRDVEQWMSHRRLPDKLRRRVREAERYNWAATRGVNEEMLLEVLPEDLQTDIRRHLFTFIKKVRIFALMDEPILDSICGRLRQKTYIKGSIVLCRGGLIEKMVFIVRGKMESIGEDGNRISLSEGDVCGEELLAWCLEHSSVNKDGKKIRIPGQRLLSNRMVRCLTNVEAFSLRAADIEEVTSVFSRFLRKPRVQGAIRYESPYWRGLAARCIQVAWRYRKKCLQRANTSQSQSHSQLESQSQSNHALL
ncbi:probable cyclic nucleotide-gated ion channel 20, chloroplastic [Pyrus x bretschneideri]|uniref:probable cyclic nucleotide-gated ion channel 20, chloroplastic n=1 Tax=Pyrus x bretschneideri TaxID=225117 RepID=UPI00202E3870|nr:probable cyclic nucleotide-gated ion channel 20, chloroplastic [Pyrus x bretschneideri]XP_048443676.1 probable cyclic nucleotide-gated ion channel 20, chloroplastic [Pyrus x bretschneideri]